MALFAPVAPLNILQKLHEHKQLGKYHLVLAHDVLKNQQGFYNLFRKPEYTFGMTVIVDNSVIELGVPVSGEDIKKAAVTFSHAGSSRVVMVLPDELWNCGKTLIVAAKALEEWVDPKLPKGLATQNFMFVPQGRNLSEFVLCAESFANKYEDHITHLGIARNITQICGSRQQATTILHACFPGAELHLLGFSDSMFDDVICARMSGVTGIDSAVPCRLFEHDMKLSDGKYESRHPEWWDNAPWSNSVLNNVRKVRRWIGEDE